MTNDIQLYQNLLNSWDNCIRKGLARDIEKPILMLSKEELKIELENKRNKIQTFNDFMYRHIDTIKNVKSDYCFLLVNEDGCLLSAKYRPGLIESNFEYRDFFISGSLFNEESIGTNAVSLTRILKRPVYLYPGFHYCNKLKNWYVYCIPVINRNKPVGFISLVSIRQPISKVLEGFSNLLTINVFSEYFLSGEDNMRDSCTTTQLTEKQNMILRMIAQGLSDEYISQELNLSLATIKYHNKAIFQKLNATSRVDAVVKAIMLNKITCYDLYNTYV
ncbi:MAG TPA: LuxR C-terminal-related transcriptional regulator [Clostridia bacterium]